jgi:hypothetical protein
MNLTAQAVASARANALLWIVALALVGCARRPQAPTPSIVPVPGKPALIRTNAPADRLLAQWRGRVDRVNPKPPYVILSFPIGSLPRVDTHLNVYRNNIKVAEVRVTLPQQDNLTAADVIAGECQVGDEARSE